MPSEPAGQQQPALTAAASGAAGQGSYRVVGPPRNQTRALVNTTLAGPSLPWLTLQGRPDHPVCSFTSPSSSSDISSQLGELCDESFAVAVTSVNDNNVTVSSYLAQVRCGRMLVFFLVETPAGSQFDKESNLATGIEAALPKAQAIPGALCKTPPPQVSDLRRCVRETGFCISLLLLVSADPPLLNGSTLPSLVYSRFWLMSLSIGHAACASADRGRSWLLLGEGPLEPFLALFGHGAMRAAQRQACASSWTVCGPREPGSDRIRPRLRRSHRHRSDRQSGPFGVLAQ